MRDEKVNDIRTTLDTCNRFDWMQIQFDQSGSSKTSNQLIGSETKKDKEIVKASKELDLDAPIEFADPASEEQIRDLLERF